MTHRRFAVGLIITLRPVRRGRRPLDAQSRSDARAGDLLVATSGGLKVFARPTACSNHIRRPVQRDVLRPLRLSVPR